MAVKKIELLQLIVVTLLIVGTSCSAQEIDATKVKISEQQNEADYSIPTDLEDLAANSDIIVKVKALQDKGNDKEDGEVLGSKKEVEIIKSFKGNLKEGDRAIVYEPAFILDGEYKQTESYVKMTDRDAYILFLNRTDEPDGFAIVSLGYGKYSEKEAYKGEVTSFKALADLKPYDFVADEEEDIDKYKTIKKDVLKKYK